MKILKMVRHAFEGSIDGADEIAIFGKREQSFAGWTNQATRLYNATMADPDLLARFAQYSITLENLQEGVALMAELMVLKHNQEGRKGLAQQATRDRDAALKDLHRWFQPFKQACLNCFEDQPDILETLGFTQYSVGYVKNKNKDKKGTDTPVNTDPVTDPATDPATNPAAEPVTDPAPVTDPTPPAAEEPAQAA